MDKKYIVIIVIALIVILCVSAGLSYMFVIEKKENNVQTNNNEIKSSTVDNKVTVVKEEDKYKELNKDSAFAYDLLNSLPNKYQTYSNKMTSDYMLYEVVAKLSNDENVQKVEYNDFFGYKFDDVQTLYTKTYGPDVKIEKKLTYLSPVEYIDEKDIFIVYPYALDNTDNKMLIKKVEENSTSYKVTVYSICVYVDLSSENFDEVYLLTKDTMRKYYTSSTRNNEDIISTYKKYTLEDGSLDLQKVVEQYENDLPLIEYYLTKSGDSYFVSDIKDIY